MAQSLKASCKITAIFQLEVNRQIWNSTIPRPHRFRTVPLATILKFISLQGDIHIFQFSSIYMCEPFTLN